MVLHEKSYFAHIEVDEFFYHLGLGRQVDLHEVLEGGQNLVAFLGVLATVKDHLIYVLVGFHQKRRQAEFKEQTEGALNLLHLLGDFVSLDWSVLEDGVDILELENNRQLTLREFEESKGFDSLGVREALTWKMLATLLSLEKYSCLNCCFMVPNLS